VNNLANHDLAIHRKLGSTKKRKLAVFDESITLELPVASQMSIFGQLGNTSTGADWPETISLFFAFVQMDSSCTISSSININLASPQHPPKQEGSFLT
jgi:hypothetical protein